MTPRFNKNVGTLLDETTWQVFHDKCNVLGLSHCAGGREAIIAWVRTGVDSSPLAELSQRRERYEVAIKEVAQGARLFEITGDWTLAEQVVQVADDFKIPVPKEFENAAAVIRSGGAKPPV